MAQFRGTIQGQRGLASRLGTKDSGLVVTANGWDTGVTVELVHSGGVDEVRVYRTGGSNNSTGRLIAAWSDLNKSSLPLCVQAMGCLCAGHARGNDASEPCDTSE